MASAKTRIGPRLRQDNGLLVRETLLRVEPTVDLYVREKWQDTQSATTLPVVLLHGAGMDSAGFDVPVDNASLVDALVSNNSHTFAFDFRGHGRSSRVADGFSVTVETSVADTLAVLDYVQEVTGAAQAIPVGVSFGAVVASVVAERIPRRIAGIVLLGLAYKTSGISLDDALAEAAKAPAGYAFATEEGWPNLFIPSATPAVTAWHQAQFGTAYAYPVGPFFEIKKLPHATALGHFRGHTLIINGDLDPFANRADTKDFIHALGTPGEKVIYVRQENVGHMPYVEATAQAIQRVINKFIATTTADNQ